MGNKKLNFEELKELVFKLDKATKQNKDRLFKLAKANGNLKIIKKLKDEFTYKNAKKYLDKLDTLSLEKIIKSKDINLLEKIIKEGIKTSHINIAELVKQDYNIKFIGLLIDNGSDINARAKTSIGELGFTALHIASEKRNNIELVKALISKGANLNILNQLYATALITASYWGNSEIVKLLCEADANLNNQDAEGATALFLSIQHKYMDIVDILLEYGADINIPINTGASPLMTAIVNNDYLMVKKILENNADIHLKFSDNRYPYYNYTALDIAYKEKDIKQSELINKGKIFIYEDNGKEKIKGGLNDIGILAEYEDIIDLLEDAYLSSSVFINECFEKINSTITSPFIAERFVLEELDSATGGNKEAQKWAKKCGYKEHEYLDALSKSLPEVDGAEGPQQLLTRLIFPYFVKDMSNENRHDLVASVRRQVIDKIIKYHSLGKYKKNIQRIQLNNFNIIDIYNDYLIFDNNKYENLDDNKYFNLDIQTYIQIENKVVIFSYVDYNNEQEKDIFEIINRKKILDKALIITEGKTDWKHLKKAFDRFQKLGIYLDLNIEFKPFENISMSDSELDNYAQSHAKKINPQKLICIFDRDLPDRIKEYGQAEFVHVKNKQLMNTIKDKFKKEYGENSKKYLELEKKLDSFQYEEIDKEFRDILTGKEYKEWEIQLKNNVYAFCIPKLSDELDEICIEFYYKEKDLKKEDANGKRLFIADEFKFKEKVNNCNRFISKCGKYKTDTQSGKNHNRHVTLQYPNKNDYGYVYKVEEEECNKSNHLNLSKNKFAENILNEVEGFDNFNIEDFRLIFDVIEKIVND